MLFNQKVLQRRLYTALTLLFGKSSLTLLIDPAYCSAKVVVALLLIAPMVAVLVTV